METGIVTIQEPVSTKTNVGEAPAGVMLDHLSMEVDKVNLSTVLDDEITSRDCRNNIIPGEADVSDVVNGSGNKETEEFESEKREMTLVEDSKIVKEKASENTEKDEQDSIIVHEPESFNKSIEDAKIILSDVTLEKEKEENLTRKPEEVSVEKPVIEEDHAETKHSQEQEEIDNISKQNDTAFGFSNKSKTTALMGLRKPKPTTIQVSNLKQRSFPSEPPAHKDKIRRDKAEAALRVCTEEVIRLSNQFAALDVDCAA